jgi:AAA-like domain/Effector-associated domain 4
MANHTYGKQNEQFVLKVFEALFDHAQSEAQDITWKESLKIYFDTNKVGLKKICGAIIEKTYENEIRPAISHYLSEFLGILEHRKPKEKRQGSDIWQFDLKIWSQDKEENRKQFAIVWQQKKETHATRNLQQILKPSVDLIAEALPKLNLRQNCKEHLDLHAPQIDDNQPSQLLINHPTRPLSFDSHLYIERESVEIDIKKQISEIGACIRILAPSKFGKTSLCRRIQSHFLAQGYRTVYINIKELRETFSDYKLFIQGLYSHINEQLNLDDCDKNITNKVRLNQHIETILEQVDTPLLFILEGVETVYSTPVSSTFRDLARGWYTKTADPQNKQWRKIRQLIVSSIIDHGENDINHSELNIGISYTLEEFNKFNAIELAKKYGLDWNEEDAGKLMSLVGGHPYLISLALYHFTTNKDFTLNQLSNTNEVGEHLRHIKKCLERDSKAKLELQRAISSRQGIIILEGKSKYALYSLGLIKYEENRAKIRCELYARNLGDYLDSTLEE